MKGQSSARRPTSQNTAWPPEVNPDDMKFEGNTKQDPVRQMDKGLGDNAYVTVDNPDDFDDA